MTSMAKDETLGRREVDNDKNIGNLLCPCCSSRMVTERGTLVERHGDEQTLWIPRPSKSSEDAEETLTWEQDTHQWWWSIPDIDDFSNVGLSRLVESPAGPIKIVLCSECQSGPYGYTTESAAPTAPNHSMYCGRLRTICSAHAHNAAAAALIDCNGPGTKDGLQRNGCKARILNLGSRVIRCSGG